MSKHFKFLPFVFYFIFFFFFFFVYSFSLGSPLTPRLEFTQRDLNLPGPLAQSVGQLTRKSGVLGSIPSLATYFRFSIRFFQEGQLSVTGESMCTKYCLTA